MQNIYIVKTKDNKLHCFYHTNESGINMRTYEQNKWGKSINIFPDALQNYTLTLSKNGTFYIFCSDKSGNINSCVGSGDSWNTHIVLRNQSPVIHNVIFSPLFTPSGLKLIYNMPSPEDKSHFIMTQSLAKNGEWSAPSRLDRISPFSNNIFTTQLLSDDHAIVFYQTKPSETNLGYREITDAQNGSFNVIHSTGYQIADTSFLTTNNTIHTAYVVKSLFSSQLIYKKRDSEGFSGPIPIWESQRIENCLLMISKSRLYIYFASSTSLYSCYSDDNGETFSRPVRYKEKICQNPIKAYYISETQMDESGYFCREVYVDKQNPFSVQIISEINDIVQIYEPPKNNVQTQDKPPSPDSSNEYKSTQSAMQSGFDPFMPPPDYNELSKMQQIPQKETEHDYPEMIMRLKNSLRIAKNHLSEKDTQLQNYMNILKTRNEEMAASEASYRDGREKLEMEISKLRKQMDRLKQENEVLILQRQSVPIKEIFPQQPIYSAAEFKITEPEQEQKQADITEPTNDIEIDKENR